MNSRLSNLRQLCLSSTCLAVGFGSAMVAVSAPASADSMSSSPSIFTAVSDVISNPNLHAFLNADTPFSAYGITMYGTVDIGVNNMTHGTPSSDTFATNVGGMLQKNDYSNSTYLAHSALEQSKLGIKGSEEIYDGFNVVFKLETAINPLNGEIINGQRSLITNGQTGGGHWLAGTTLMGDTSRDGQLFQGGAFGGLSHATYGTLTFGRHLTPMGDLILAYDPQEGSNAFSPIGLSGAAMGMGDTEDARLDQSIKYNVKYGPARLAALYQLPKTESSTGGDDAYEINLGADYGALSVDALYGVKHDAINISNPATAAQAALNELAPTVSDNHVITVLAKYDIKPVKVYAGYERIVFTDPSSPLTAANVDSSSLGGYNYAFSGSTNTAYAIHKTQHIVWTGEQYSITDQLKFDLAYYMYIVDNYSGMTEASCLSAGQKSCAGTEEFVSGVLDYRFNKRIDVYTGMMYSRINDGMYVGNSFLHNNTLSSSAGLRFKF